MTIALIDGDIFVYQAAAACEKATCWGDIDKPYLWTQHVDVEEAYGILKSNLKSAIKASGADDFKIAISDHGNCFRKSILPSYKANRSGKKPMGILPLEQMLAEEYGISVFPKLEADDVLGIWQTEGIAVGCDTVIVSIDKDMKTLPGKFYNPDTKELHNGTQSEATWWHMYQTLVGDATDGYTGLPSVGPKTAEKILDKAADDLWALVVDAYVSKDLTEEDALVQARCAKILTNDLYDQQTKEVKLWVPA